MSRADDLVRGAGAGAEIELLEGETLVVEADAVRAASRPVLHIAEVSVSIKRHLKRMQST
jgi:hypothetical protein